MVSTCRTKKDYLVDAKCTRFQHPITPIARDDRNPIAGFANPQVKIGYQRMYHLGTKLHLEVLFPCLNAHLQTVF